MSRSILIFLLLGCTLTIQAQTDDERPAYYIFSIYFGGGSYYIDPGQHQELLDWLDNIPDLDQQEISIHGHTDDIGSQEYNAWLSSMRCQSALQKLIDRGIRHDQITIEEFGELNPVYDNSTWEGKLKNRRVDIIVKPVII